MSDFLRYLIHYNIKHHREELFNILLQFYPTELQSEIDINTTNLVDMAEYAISLENSDTEGDVSDAIIKMSLKYEVFKNNKPKESEPKKEKKVVPKLNLPILNNFILDKDFYKEIIITGILIYAIISTIKILKK